MEKKTSDEEYIQNKFQILIGEEKVWIEVISLKNHIYAVEYPGKEPLFITNVKDKDNQSRWISIPQGDDDLASAIGGFIDERLHTKK
jgi:hypothetical protein